MVDVKYEKEHRDDKKKVSVQEKMGLDIQKMESQVKRLGEFDDYVRKDISDMRETDIWYADHLVDSYQHKSEVKTLNKKMDRVKKDYKAMDKAQKEYTAQKYNDLFDKMKELKSHVKRDRHHDVGGPEDILQCPNGSIVFNWCEQPSIPNSQFFKTTIVTEKNQYLCPADLPT